MNNFFSNIKSLSIIFLLVFVLSCDDKIKGKSLPNFVIIFVDDMGFGDLSCYGHPVIKTPNLDNMAAEGVRFTQFYVAASVCTPSRAALLTGRYPVRHLHSNVGPESTNGLPVSEITLADILNTAGYKTKAIGKWHLGHRPQYLPTSNGFDSFYGLPYSNDMILPWCPWMTADQKLMLYVDSIPVKEIGKNQEDLTVNFTNEALKFIEENKNQPFFLYLAHPMPHLPISTSDRFRGKSTAGLYGDVIHSLDWSVGQVLQTLKENGIDENTLVIFTSDNGPWHNLPDRMLQEGVQRWHTGSTGMLSGSKMTSYEGGFRVPAIARWPGIIPKNSVSREVVTTMDIFPTIVSIAGQKVPEDREIDGINILSLLKGENTGINRSFFYSRGKTIHAIRKGDWKLRVTKGEGVQLFNLSKDIGEMYNRAAELPDLVDSLYVELKNFGKTTGSKVHPK